MNKILFFNILRLHFLRVAVLNELEGLARGGGSRDCPPASRAALNPQHVARIAESAKAALTFARSRHPTIRCVTTKGTVLASTNFTVEEGGDLVSNSFFLFLKFYRLATLRNTH